MYGVVFTTSNTQPELSHTANLLAFGILAISRSLIAAVIAAWVSRDIRERKRREEAVRIERDIAREYFQIADVMLLILNPNYTVRLINRKGCEVLDWSEHEIIEKNWGRFLPPEDRDKVTRAFSQ